MSGHAFWEVPMEVIFEMMDDDTWDRVGESLAERNYEGARRVPVVTRTIPPQRRDDPPRPTFQSPKHLLKCATCGCGGLEWKMTPHGERLVYAAAPKSAYHILGKIHACPEE